MPNSKAKRFCNRPSCPALVDSGYCDKHKPVVDQTEKNRIYNYRWTQVRSFYLAENPICVDCLADGKVTAAQEVHHTLKAREHPDKRFDTHFLMALCKACHSIRTARGE